MGNQAIVGVGHKELHAIVTVRDYAVLWVGFSKYQNLRGRILVHGAKPTGGAVLVSWRCNHGATEGFRMSAMRKDNMYSPASLAARGCRTIGEEIRRKVSKQGVSSTKRQIASSPWGCRRSKVGLHSRRCNCQRHDRGVPNK